VTGGWRKLHNEELRDLYSSPSVIRIIKSREDEIGGTCRKMGRREAYIGCWYESKKERDH
jgi:hypothetical protein